MQKVTRTIVTTVARYTNAKGEQCVTRLNMADPSIVKALVEQGATNLEVGYVPCLYSMSIQQYMEKADCLTDLSIAEIYKSADQCPTRAVRTTSKQSK